MDNRDCDKDNIVSYFHGDIRIVYRKNYKKKPVTLIVTRDNTYIPGYRNEEPYNVWLFDWRKDSNAAQKRYVGPCDDLNEVRKTKNYINDLMS